MLEGKRIFVVVDGTQDEAPMEDVNAQALYTENARMARAVIVTSLGDKILEVILNAKTANEMWDNLESRYEVV